MCGHSSLGKAIRLFLLYSILIERWYNFPKKPCLSMMNLRVFNFLTTMWLFSENVYLYVCVFVTNICRKCISSWCILYHETLNLILNFYPNILCLSIFRGNLFNGWCCRYDFFKIFRIGTVGSKIILALAIILAIFLLFDRHFLSSCLLWTG